MSFTHYPFSSEWSGWVRSQPIQMSLVVILEIQNSGTLAKITLNRISSWEDGWTSKRVNGNRRRWYAIKASSWSQTEDIRVTWFSPTLTPTVLAFDKGPNTSMHRQFWGSGVCASVYIWDTRGTDILLQLIIVYSIKELIDPNLSHTQTNFCRELDLGANIFNIHLFAVNCFYRSNFQSLGIIQSTENIVSGK